ncbi:MAG: tRNA (adenosine(37)-N6)-threonylcarbamoyltransferase complex transferase subunit TsaD [Actinobacteria bacterium]|nr:tRNA (adenosine(37)-N6)-threonylcarbamoyltransferase complex transferase subunit TsaD [Actinomycetota bacterium]
MGLVLAIETSCDETAAAVVDFNYNVLSNIVASQVEYHRKFGGVVPEIASRKHVENINFVVDSALEKAGVSFSDIDVFASTKGPGLIGALLVGMATAKSYALVYRKPLIFVDHIEAHIWSNFLDGKKPKLPAITLVVSGGHTSFYLLDENRNLMSIGETIDDAVGEAFDKVAKILNLPYPGGPEIEKIARESKNPVEFVRPYLDSGDLNFSFSGLKTAVLYYLRKNPDAKKEDVAAGFQNSVIDVLVQKTEQAIRKYRANSVLLAGGVIANSAIRNAFIEFSKKEGVEVSFPQFQYCTDNAAMVGARAVDSFLAGKIGSFSEPAYSTVRPTKRV